MTVKENMKIAGEIVLNDSSHGTDLALYMLNFSEGSKHLFTFYVIPPHWHDTGSWNHSWCETRTCLFYITNIMAADDLVTQGARTSAAMILA